jgi:hypothetical protein
MTNEKRRIVRISLVWLMSAGIAVLRPGGILSSTVEAAPPPVDDRPLSQGHPLGLNLRWDSETGASEKHLLRLFRGFLEEGQNSWGSPTVWKTKRDLCLNPNQRGVAECSKNSEQWHASSFQILALHGLQEPAQQRLALLEKTDERLNSSQCQQGEPCIASAVLYNPIASTDIESSRVNLKTTLDGLVPPMGSSKSVDIPSLRDRSIIVKTLWEVVKREKKLAFVWDPDPDYLVQANPDGSLGAAGSVNWHQSVLRVDTSDKACASTYYQLNSKKPVPVGCFRKIYITKTNVRQIDQSALNGVSVAPGDYIVLVGIHIIEKVNGQWVWSTFWWTNNPGFYSKNGGGRNVGGRWTHYVMKSTINDAKTPLSNPYIEGPDAHTMKLNCITCHKYAVYPLSQQEVDISNGQYPNGLQGQAGLDYFAGKVHTDRLWSLVTKYMQ